jgi:hypothetical protein
MLRTVVATLLVANVLFFAWTQGWLGPAPGAAQREPQRLAAQMRPELVTVLPPRAASAAVSAARDAALACLEAGPFPRPGSEGGTDIAAAEAIAVQQAQLPAAALRREAVPPPPAWIVFAGRWPDAAARGTRVQELRRLGLSPEEISAPADLAPGLVLSRHADRAAAESAMASAAAAASAAGQGAIRGLRVVELPPPAQPQQWLRVPRADPDQQARLDALPDPAKAALGGGFRPCGARP